MIFINLHTNTNNAAKRQGLRLYLKCNYHKPKPTSGIHNFKVKCLLFSTKSRSPLNNPNWLFKFNRAEFKKKLYEQLFKSKLLNAQFPELASAEKLLSTLEHDLFSFVTIKNPFKNLITHFLTYLHNSIEKILVYYPNHRQTKVDSPIWKKFWLETTLIGTTISKHQKFTFIKDAFFSTCKLLKNNFKISWNAICFNVKLLYNILKDDYKKQLFYEYLKLYYYYYKQLYNVNLLVSIIKFFFILPLRYHNQDSIDNNALFDITIFKNRRFVRLKHTNFRVSYKVFSPLYKRLDAIYSRLV